MSLIMSVLYERIAKLEQERDDLLAENAQLRGVAMPAQRKPPADSPPPCDHSRGWARQRVATETGDYQ